MYVYLVTSTWVDDCEPGHQLSIWHDFNSALKEFKKVVKRNSDQAKLDGWIEDKYQLPSQEEGREYASYTAYEDGAYSEANVEVTFEKVLVKGNMTMSEICEIGLLYDSLIKEDDIKSYIKENPQYKDVDISLAASLVDKKMGLSDTYWEIYNKCIAESVEDASNE